MASDSDSFNDDDWAAFKKKALAEHSDNPVSAVTPKLSQSPEQITAKQRPELLLPLNSHQINTTDIGGDGRNRAEAKAAAQASNFQSNVEGQPVLLSVRRQFMSIASPEQSESDGRSKGRYVDTQSSDSESEEVGLSRRDLSDSELFLHAGRDPRLSLGVVSGRTNSDPALNDMGSTGQSLGFMPSIAVSPTQPDQYGAEGFEEDSRDDDERSGSVTSPGKSLTGRRGSGVASHGLELGPTDSDLAYRHPVDFDSDSPHRRLVETDVAYRHPASSSPGMASSLSSSAQLSMVPARRLEDSGSSQDAETFPSKGSLNRPSAVLQPDSRSGWAGPPDATTSSVSNIGNPHSRTANEAVSKSATPNLATAVGPAISSSGVTFSDPIRSISARANVGSSDVASDRLEPKGLADSSVADLQGLSGGTVGSASRDAFGETGRSDTKGDTRSDTKERSATNPDGGNGSPNGRLSWTTTVEVPLDLEQWSPSEIAKWLKAIGLPQYKDRFISKSIDGPALLKIAVDNTELKEVYGILSLKHRDHLRRQLEWLNVCLVAGRILSGLEAWDEVASSCWINAAFDTLPEFLPSPSEHSVEFGQLLDLATEVETLVKSPPRPRNPEDLERWRRDVEMHRQKYNQLKNKNLMLDEIEQCFMNKLKVASARTHSEISESRQSPQRQQKIWEKGVKKKSVRKGLWAKAVEKWDNKDVSHWVEEIDLPSLLDRVRQGALTGPDLLSTPRSELEERLNVNQEQLRKFRVGLKYLKQWNTVRKGVLHLHREASHQDGKLRTAPAVYLTRAEVIKRMERANKEKQKRSGMKSKTQDEKESLVKDEFNIEAVDDETLDFAIEKISPSATKKIGFISSEEAAQLKMQPQPEKLEALVRIAEMKNFLERHEGKVLRPQKHREEIIGKVSEKITQPKKLWAPPLSNDQRKKWEKKADKFIMRVFGCPKADEAQFNTLLADLREKSFITEKKEERLLKLKMPQKREALYRLAQVQDHIERNRLQTDPKDVRELKKKAEKKKEREKKDLQHEQECIAFFQEELGWDISSGGSSRQHVEALVDGFLDDNILGLPDDQVDDIKAMNYVQKLRSLVALLKVGAFLGKMEEDLQKRRQKFGSNESKSEPQIAELAPTSAECEAYFLQKMRWPSVTSELLNDLAGHYSLGLPPLELNRIRRMPIEDKMQQLYKALLADRLGGALSFFKQKLGWATVSTERLNQFVDSTELGLDPEGKARLRQLPLHLKLQELFGRVVSMDVTKSKLPPGAQGIPFCEAFFRRHMGWPEVTADRLDDLLISFDLGLGTKQITGVKALALPEKMRYLYNRIAAVYQFPADAVTEAGVADPENKKKIQRFLDRVQDDLQRRKESLARLEKRLEVDDPGRRECTFAPNLRKPRSSCLECGPALVSGKRPQHSLPLHPDMVHLTSQYSRTQAIDRPEEAKAKAKDDVDEIGHKERSRNLASEAFLFNGIDGKQGDKGGPNQNIGDWYFGKTEFGDEFAGIEYGRIDLPPWYPHMDTISDLNIYAGEGLLSRQSGGPLTTDSRFDAIGPLPSNDAGGSDRPLPWPLALPTDSKREPIPAQPSKVLFHHYVAPETQHGPDNQPPLVQLSPPVGQSDYPVPIPANGVAAMEKLTNQNPINTPTTGTGPVSVRAAIPKQGPSLGHRAATTPTPTQTQPPVGSGRDPTPSRGRSPRPDGPESVGRNATVRVRASPSGAPIGQRGPSPLRSGSNPQVRTASAPGAATVTSRGGDTATRRDATPRRMAAAPTPNQASSQPARFADLPKRQQGTPVLAKHLTQDGPVQVKDIAPVLAKPHGPAEPTAVQRPVQVKDMAPSGVASRQQQPVHVNNQAQVMPPSSVASHQQLPMQVNVQVNDMTSSRLASRQQTPVQVNPQEMAHSKDRMTSGAVAGTPPLPRQRSLHLNAQPNLPSSAAADSSRLAGPKPIADGTKAPPRDFTQPLPLHLSQTEAPTGRDVTQPSAPSRNVSGRSPTPKLSVTGSSAPTHAVPSTSSIADVPSTTSQVARDVTQPSHGRDVTQPSRSRDTQPSLGRDVTQSSLGRDVTQPSVGRDVTQPSHGNDVTQPSHSRDVTQPSLGRDVTQSSLGRDVTQSSLRLDVTQSSAGRDVTQSSPGRDVTQSSVGRDVNQSSLGRDVTQSSLGRDVTQPSTGRDVTQSSVGRDVTQSSVRRDVTQSSVGSDVTQSSVDRDVTQSSIGRDFTQPSLGRDVTHSSLGRDFTQTSLGRDVTQPSIVHDVARASSSFIDPAFAPTSAVRDTTHSSLGRDVTHSSLGRDVTQSSVDPAFAPASAVRDVTHPSTGLQPHARDDPSFQTGTSALTITTALSIQSGQSTSEREDLLGRPFAKDTGPGSFAGTAQGPLGGSLKSARDSMGLSGPHRPDLLSFGSSSVGTGSPYSRTHDEDDGVKFEGTMTMPALRDPTR